MVWKKFFFQLKILNISSFLKTFFCQAARGSWLASYTYYQVIKRHSMYNWHKYSW